MRPRKYFLISLLLILFFLHPQQAFPQTPDGDLAPLGNRDGIVTVGDALVALRFALLLETPTQEDIQHGDVAPLDNSGLPSPDGQITVGDALVILRHALGLISLTPTGVSGLWTISMTQTGETEEKGVVILLLQSDTALSLEIITLDTTATTGTATLTGTQIALSCEEAGKTISLTGTVANDTMSGTWTDTSGGSGTWSAQSALELGDPQLTFPETGTIVLELQVGGDIGSATFYGTETDQGPAFPLTGFTMTTPEGECVVTLDDQKRPVTMTMGTMEITFTYNEDDTFNYELKENGSLIYSGSAISTGEGNTTKSVFSHSARSTNSAGIGDLTAEKPLRHGRSNGRDETKILDDSVYNILTEFAESEAQFLESLLQDKSLRSVVVIAIMTDLYKKSLDTLRSLVGPRDRPVIDEVLTILNFANPVLLPLELEDNIASLWDEYNGGKYYDFDKDGFSESEGDCNDRNDKIHPNAKEKCNGYDDNCKDGTDEGVTTTYYMDFDGDGFGNANLSIQACKQPVLFVTDNRDCNDADPNENPLALWGKDADDDGCPYDGNLTQSCLRPQGYKSANELSCLSIDCDDNDPERAWGNPEVCNDGKDNDCDELVDCDDPDCVNDPACPQCPRAGDPANYTQPCDNGCIPAGAVCCHDGKGGWCPADSQCWGASGCCPTNCICDNITCMPTAGYVCCNEGNGSYCPPEHPICCPGGCCDVEN